MTRPSASRLFALTLLVAAIYPTIAHQLQRRRVADRVDRLKVSTTSLPPGLADSYQPDPAFLVRVAEIGPLLAGWQTIGGCGAGSGSGGGAGVKWIGRGVSGGLFSLQTQLTYTRIHSGGKLEQHLFLSTLVMREITEKWTGGISLPFVYKYLGDRYTDPFDAKNNVDVSNGGLGDISLQVTRKFGRINDTTLTAVLGLPSGKYDSKYSGAYLQQQQQLGFGMPTATVVLDHVMDEIWGLVVVGGTASWRGGKNKLDSYRAPNASTYVYSGYFIGPLVPAAGLSLTGYGGHDKDLTTPQASPLFSVGGNVSLEWSTDWIAVLAGASMPYQYDGLSQVMGLPHSAWGLGPWTVALGLALSPF